MKPLIEEHDWDRFMRLRQRLFKAIKECLEIDGHYKSYEGRFDIDYSLPNYFEDGEREPQGSIHLACYLIGPNRGEDWYGKTFHDVLLRMEKDVTVWLDDHDDWLETYEPWEDEDFESV